MTPLRVIDRVQRNTAFGVRFWDTASASGVIPGLQVEVFARTRPGARARAQMTPSGIYVTHAVPGLREWEFMEAGSDELWAQAASRYRVEVRDPMGRFLPIAFDADLPARSLFTWRAPWFSPPRAIVLPGEPGSPAQLMLERVPLFSAPARGLPHAAAVLRAQLRILGLERPAAWTLLAVTIDGAVRGIGLSDAEGRIAVVFPYPEPPRRALTSPPEARNDFSWELELTAFIPAPLLASPPRAVPLADLTDIFDALNTPRVVVESFISPALPLRLSYREPLTVRTAGATGADASYLFVAV